MISGLLKDLRLAGSLKIIRRYFVINSFDGVIVMLGILFGFYLAGVGNVKVIISAGIGAAVAMCVSGMSGVYLSEKAEKEKELREIERAMVRKLDRTELGEALKNAPLATALVDGFSPFIFSLLILLPFLLSGIMSAPIISLYYSSFIICALCLFLLGMFMGNTARKNVWVYGAKTVVVGLVTAAVLMILNYLFNL